MATLAVACWLITAAAADIGYAGFWICAKGPSSPLPIPAECWMGSLLWGTAPVVVGGVLAMYAVRLWRSLRFNRDAPRTGRYLLAATAGASFCIISPFTIAALMHRLPLV